MPPSRENIMEICTLLAQQENLKVTIEESGKCAIMAGFGALAGGILGGPVGVAIGGSVASITAAWCSKRKFKSVVEVIQQDMTPQQQQRLADAVTAAIRNIQIEDIAMLGSLALSNGSIKELVLKELGSFLMRELSMNMVSI